MVIAFRTILKKFATSSAALSALEVGPLGSLGIKPDSIACIVSCIAISLVEIVKQGTKYRSNKGGGKVTNKEARQLYLDLSRTVGKSSNIVRKLSIVSSIISVFIIVVGVSLIFYSKM